MQDSERLVCSVIAILERNAAVGSAHFKTMACAMISVDRGLKPEQAAKESSAPRQRPADNMGAPGMKSKPSRKQIQASATRKSTSNITTIKREESGERRATAPADSGKPPNSSRGCRQNTISSTATPGSLHLGHYEQMVKGNLPSAASSFDALNLDYLSFGHDTDPTPSYPNTGCMQPGKEVSPDEFAGILNSAPLQAPFDSLFPSTDVFAPYITPSPSTAHFDCGPDAWTIVPDTSKQAATQSVRSLTDEEITSGEELSVGDIQSEHRGMAMPNADGFGLAAFDVDFGA